MQPQFSLALLGLILVKNLQSIYNSLLSTEGRDGLEFIMMAYMA